MRAIAAYFQPSTLHSRFHQPRILPDRQMLSSGQRARKERFPRLQLQDVYSGLNSHPRLVSHLELHWLARLLLRDGHSVPYSSSDTDIVQIYSDEITPAKLTIDRQTEHCQVAFALRKLQADPDRPPLSASRAAFDR
jgi:hypothetical protein